MSTHILSQPIKRIVKVENKVVGHIEGDRFIKHVLGYKHKLRCPPAWAIDVKAFDNEIKPNAKEFVVIDKETGIEYHASVETFARHSFRFNRGFSDQYALPLQYWHTKSNGNRQLCLFGDESNA